MPKFLCPYSCSGTPHTALIDAADQREAIAVMNDLSWGEHSGPSGEPKLVRTSGSFDAPANLAAHAAVALTITSLLVGLSGHHLKNEAQKFETARHTAFHKNAVKKPHLT